ncbi:HAD-IIB family hydrolase [Rhodalgimonas zhirmunskyi]|uniref:HAD-IIB family hydrolase n=1 Tax=Rhodalgimonas zhirmunskyi TaxID=2964767 RepID=A0AAJ1UB69_9RHOB|nr:HAD-IIB family hydrolase [Rhodoalgimonas zhirmunskyi]MDQ2094618.1 HAD-IIB family hydrolase [Rhodoalgimonas zhirmunskyi]
MNLIIFTDLDGTLLDHESYSYAPAQEALSTLKARDVPLILASSKTAAEIAGLHAALGLGEAPAIVENGAAVWHPGAADEAGEAYARLRGRLDAVPAVLRAKFTGFGDMSAAEVAEVTGLSPEAAALAQARAHSEPGLWQGDGESETEFRAVLHELGVTARRGGRFLTLSFGGTKAGRMAEIAARYGTPKTMALGDAPNDIEMIEAADRGVIIRNDHGTNIPTLLGETEGRILRTDTAGPTGWNRAVLEALNDMDTKQGT